MEQDYRNVFEHAGLPMIILNHQGKYLDHNMTYRKLMGFEELEDLKDAHPIDVSPEFQPDGARSTDRIREVLNIALEEGSHRFPWMHQSKDGEEFLSDVMLERIHFGGEMCIKASIYDIDEESKIQRLVREKTEELEKQNMVLESFFSNQVVGLMLSDAGRVIVRANEQMARILKCEVEDIVGNTMRRWCISDEYYAEFGDTIKKAIMANEPLKSEFQYVAKDGTYVWCQFSGGPMDNNYPPDMSKGMYWLIEDISDRKVLEAKLSAQYELAKDANPLTGLPGNNTIKKTIQQAVMHSTDSSIMYVDIDNFKSYNDAYGFVKGDEVLTKLAEILNVAGRLCGALDYFAGNIGGDDFVIVTETGASEAVSRYIIAEFDQLVNDFYNEYDRSQGYIIGEDRDGTVRRIPLMSISIAAVALDLVRGLNYIEVIDICAEVKSECKKVEGSVYLDNRRHFS